MAMRADSIRRVGQRIGLDLTLAVGSTGWPLRLNSSRFGITTTTASS